MENERKEQKSSETELKLKGKIQRIKLHLIYISIIFSAVIITILSLHFYSDDLNSKFVGYAATISSLILSVLAIIITVISNDSTNGLMHKIRDIYEAISANPEKIADSVNCINHASESLDNSVKAITGISEKIEDLSTSVNINLSKIEVFHESLPNRITTDLSQIFSYQLGDKATMVKNNEVKDASVKFDTSADIKVDLNNIIDHTSGYGMVILYASYISYTHQKDLDITKLTNGIFTQTVDSTNYRDYSFKYFHGYLIGISVCQGLISLINIEGQNAFKILDFNKELGALLIERFEEAFSDTGKRKNNIFHHNLKDKIIEIITKD